MFAAVVRVQWDLPTCTQGYFWHHSRLRHLVLFRFLCNEVYSELVSTHWTILLKSGQLFLWLFWHTSLVLGFWFTRLIQECGIDYLQSQFVLVYHSAMSNIRDVTPLWSAGSYVGGKPLPIYCQHSCIYFQLTFIHSKGVSVEQDNCLLILEQSTLGTGL